MSRSAKILLILLAAGLLCFGALEGAVLAGCHRRGYPATMPMWSSCWGPSFGRMARHRR